MTAKQELLEEIDSVALQIIETEEKLSELKEIENNLKRRLEAMTLTEIQSGKKVKNAPKGGFENMASF